VGSVNPGEGVQQVQWRLQCWSPTLGGNTGHNARFFGLSAGRAPYCWVQRWTQHGGATWAQCYQVPTLDSSSRGNTGLNARFNMDSAAGATLGSMLGSTLGTTLGSTLGSMLGSALGVQGFNTCWLNAGFMDSNTGFNSGRNTWLSSWAQCWV